MANKNQNDVENMPSQGTSSISIHIWVYACSYTYVHAHRPVGFSTAADSAQNISMQLQQPHIAPVPLNTTPEASDPVHEHQDSNDTPNTHTPDAASHVTTHNANENTEAKKQEPFEKFNLAALLEKSKQGLVVDKIIKPDGTGGRDFHIRDRMGLDEDNTWYSDIIVSV